MSAPNTSVIRKQGRTLAWPFRWFGRTVARLFGWTIVGPFPEPPKAIFVAAPHTYLWDGFFMQMCAWALGVRLSWITKHTMFRWPLKGFLRWSGAVPVDRRSANDTVRQVAEQFRATDEMYLAIAPAGTRSLRAHWRSGFYYMALEAGVPLVLGFLDYTRKRGGVGPVIHPTGDIEADMARIRAFYEGEGIQGKHPELQTPIMVRQELEALEQAEAS